MKSIKWLALAITGCLLLGGQAYGQAAQSAKAAKASGAAAAVDVSSVTSGDWKTQGMELLNKAKAEATEQLKKIKEGLTGLEKHIKEMSYQKSDTLSIVNAGAVIFELNLIGGPGHGTKDEFCGIVFTLTNTLPDLIPGVAKAGFKIIKLDVDDVIGKIIETPLEVTLHQLFKTDSHFATSEGQSSVKVLVSTPAMEYFFRIALLAKDMNTKGKDGKPLIDKQAFSVELLILTKKLIHTLGPKATFSDVLSQIPKPLEALLSPVKSQIQKLWGEISDLVGFDFETIKTLKTLGNSDIKKIATIMGAICLDYYLSYVEEKNAFIQTKEGQQAAAELSKNRNQKAFDAAFAAYKKAEFLKRVDALKTIKVTSSEDAAKMKEAGLSDFITTEDDVKKASAELEQYKDPKVLEAAIKTYSNKNKQLAKDRFIALGKHLSGYKTLKAKILSSLGFLDPLIAPISLKDLFPDDDEMAAQQEAKKQAAEEAAGAEALDTALGDESTSDGEVSEDSGEESSDSETSDAEATKDESDSSSEESSEEQPAEE